MVRCLAFLAVALALPAGAAEARAERARANRQAYLAKLLERNPPAINELTLPEVVARAK